jgi:hypothetical protein
MLLLFTYKLFTDAAEIPVIIHLLLIIVTLNYYSPARQRYLDFGFWEISDFVFSVLLKVISHHI